MMNIYLVIILGSMLLAYVVNTAVTALNIRSLDPRLPKAFEGTYDAGQYAKSQGYARAGARLDLLSETFGIVLVPGFVILGGFNVVDGVVRSFGWGEIVTGLAFYGVLFLLSESVSEPIRLYKTFVLEERFGFNRTTVGTYIADKLKSWLLMVVIGGPLIGMILWFFESAGPMAWLWAWGGTSLVVLVLQYLAPTMIMPLFNTFTPLQEGELRSAIEGYARENGFELTGIFVIDGSRRSAKSNAFFTGFGKRKRIALFDTLVDAMTTEEILGVVAHEMGHYKRGHIFKFMTISIAKMGLLFWIMSLFLGNPGLFEAFGMEHVSVYASLVFFMLLYSPVGLVLNTVAQALSRRYEYQADDFARQSLGDHQALVSALKRLSVSNLSNLTPHPAYVFLNYSHPPVLQRIQALENA